MANQPRVRDAAIIMLVGGVLGALLGIDIGVSAIRELPNASINLVWSGVLLVASGALCGLGVRMLRRVLREKVDAP